MLHRGKLYHALNPLFAREPLSGRGVALYGGRFNAKGMPALYCSLSVMTALREANRAGSLQPTVLVSYEAEIDRIFGCRDEAALRAEGFDGMALAGRRMARPDENRRGGADADLRPEARQGRSWRLARQEFCFRSNRRRLESRALVVGRQALPASP
jgi:RES domain-containing protein